MAVAGVLDRVHIGELAAHVGDEAKLAVWVGDQLILWIVHHVDSLLWVGGDGGGERRGVIFGLTWFFSAMTVLIMQKKVSTLKISSHGWTKSSSAQSLLIMVWRGEVLIGAANVRQTY